MAERAAPSSAKRCEVQRATTLQALEKAKLFPFGLAHGVSASTMSGLDVLPERLGALGAPLECASAFRLAKRAS